jgi:DNA polymerase-3 subunit epsilon
MEGDARPVVASARVRIDRLAVELRYEEAAAQRDRLAAFIRAAARCQRLTALARCAQLVCARPGFAGGWEVAVVRSGRLAATGVIPPRAHPRPYVDALIATAETVLEGTGERPLLAATPEEMECILRWLEVPGARLVEVDGVWSCPANGAEGMRAWIERAYTGSRPLD